ncbi:MAG: hypothetical protein WBO06_13860 [Gammaproteobacteria bacterium]
MNNIMAVFLNGIAQLEYDRDMLLPDHQAAYLDKMDSKMESGIQMGEELIRNPDLNQRAQFAAANLAHAIKTNDESTAAAMCSYLALRLPDLKQVKIEEKDGIASIEFIYDEAYRKQVAVDFPQLH